MRRLVVGATMAVFLFVLGFLIMAPVIQTLAVSGGSPRCVIICHAFVEIGQGGGSLASGSAIGTTGVYYTDVKAAITTSSCSTSSTPPVNATAAIQLEGDVFSYWIAVYTPNEFMQIGFYCSLTFGSIFGQSSKGPMAVWSDFGPVANVSYAPQDIQPITQGSLHQYEMKFDGSNWQIMLDGNTVKTISIKELATRISLDLETASYQDSTKLQAPVVNVNNVYYNLNSTSQPNSLLFSTQPTDFFYGIDSISSQWIGIISSTNGNGANVACQNNSLQLGWGLSSSITGCQPAITVQTTTVPGPTTPTPVTPPSTSGVCQYGGTYPNCNPAPPPQTGSCVYGGTYPNCNQPPLSCPYGGTYGNCNPPPPNSPPVVFVRPPARSAVSPNCFLICLSSANRIIVGAGLMIPSGISVPFMLRKSRK